MPRAVRYSNRERLGDAAIEHRRQITWILDEHAKDLARRRRSGQQTRDAQEAIVQRWLARRRSRPD
jgi:hypothetical protein